jgi:transposase
MLTMPTAYGAEFRQDVIDVARKGGAPLAQIAKDFGLSVTTLKRWIAIAERKESGAGPAAAESAEVRELKKRNRLLEPDPLPGVPEFGGFLLRYAGTGAVLDVGFL